MATDTLLVERIAQLNTKIEIISRKIEAGDSLKYISLGITIAAPLIVGIILFILTRRKEIRFKKSDLAGDIFEYIIRLQKVCSDYIILFYEMNYLTNIINLMKTERLTIFNNLNLEFYISEAKTKIEINNTLEKEIEENYINLLKKVGSYRYFLAKRKKNRIDKKLESFILPKEVCHKVIYEKQSDINKTVDAYNDAVKKAKKQFDATMNNFSQAIDDLVEKY